MKAFTTAGTDPVRNLQDAIQTHLQDHPDAAIRDVDAALQNLNAVFVTHGVDGQDEYGNDKLSGRYKVGVCCGEGEAYTIDAGMSVDRAAKMALQLAQKACRPLSQLNAEPLVMVDPDRIASVSDKRGRVNFSLQESGRTFDMVYPDAHRAHIDSYLMDVRLTHARMGNRHLKNAQQLVPEAP